MTDRNLKLSQEEFLALEVDVAATLIASRFDALRERGCDAEAAVVVAVHPEVSVAEAVELIRRGCDARMGVRILR
jgi:hypothetical protein